MEGLVALSSPLVTVLMTVRNGEPYVRRAVASILSQTMGDLELLAVDNASGDCSLETIRSFADHRVRIHENKRDLGRTKALNVGLALARGEFVAILDADDLAEPERLARQIDFMRQNPQVAMAGGGFTAIGQQGEILKEHRPPTAHQDILNCLPVWNPLAHSTMIFRRQTVMNLGGYPAKYVWAQDFALILKVASRHTLANLPVILGSIRQHPLQMTSLPENSANKLLESYQLLRKGRFVPGVPEPAKAQGREVCALLARQYLEHLAQQGKLGRALAFRLGCLPDSLKDLELREALRPVPRGHSPQQPSQPKSGVDA